MSLSSLTIVIPTMNRPKSILRAMHYWSDYDAIVHIFDGSQEPIELSLISSMSSNINYHHMPFDLMERLNKSIEFVNTKYSMMIPDDEFFIPSGLESCIEELNDNKEIVSCFGLAISFQLKGNEVLSNIVYHNLKSSSLPQNSPSDRSIAHMSNYCPSTIYSVMRTDIWKKSMRSLSYKNFEVFVASVGELQFEITTSYLGKIKVINELIWLRSYENDAIRLQESEATETIQEFWNKESNKLIKDEIINTIVESIASEEDNVSLIASDIYYAFDAYLNVYEHTPSYSYIKISQKSLISKSYKFLKAILPKSIISLLLKLLKLLKIIDVNSLKTISKQVTILHKDGIKIDFSEIKKIEKILLNNNSK